MREELRIINQKKRRRRKEEEDIKYTIIYDVTYKLIYSYILRREKIKYGPEFSYFFKLFFKK